MPLNASPLPSREPRYLDELPYDAMYERWCGPADPTRAKQQVSSVMRVRHFVVTMSWP